MSAFDEGFGTDLSGQSWAAINDEDVKEVLEPLPKTLPAKEPKPVEPVAKPVKSAQEAPFPTEAPFSALVGSLSLDATEIEVKDIFGDHSQIVDMRMMNDRESGKFKGYAYVDFVSGEALKSALEKSGTKFKGRSITVNIAFPKRNERRDEKKEKQTGYMRKGGRGKNSVLKHKKPTGDVVDIKALLTPSGKEVRKPAVDPFGGAKPREQVLEQRGNNKNMELKPAPVPRKVYSEKPKKKGYVKKVEVKQPSEVRSSNIFDALDDESG